MLRRAWLVLPVVGLVALIAHTVAWLRKPIVPAPWPTAFETLYVREIGLGVFLVGACVLLGAELYGRMRQLARVAVMVTVAFAIAGFARAAYDPAPHDHVSALRVVGVLPGVVDPPVGAIANPERWAPEPFLVYRQQFVSERGRIVLDRRCYFDECDVRLYFEGDRQLEELRGDATFDAHFTRNDSLTVRHNPHEPLWVIELGARRAAFVVHQGRFMPTGVAKFPRAPPWRWIAGTIAAVVFGLAALALARTIENRLVILERALDGVVEDGWLRFAIPLMPLRLAHTSDGPVLVEAAGGASAYRGQPDAAPKIHAGSRAALLARHQNAIAWCERIALAASTLGATPLAIVLASSAIA